MHIVFYTHDILDLGSFSSGVSWAIVIGSLYGCVRLLVDVWRSLTRRGTPPPSE